MFINQNRLRKESPYITFQDYENDLNFLDNEIIEEYPKLNYGLYENLEEEEMGTE